MKIELLSKNEKWLPKIADWYFTEWGNPNSTESIEKQINKLFPYLNESQIPLMLVAFEKNELLGVAQLKLHEMSIYPNYKYWLGGVYVDKQYRNKGIAKKIVLKAINKARQFKIDKLYLQTEDLSGGLYKNLGWTKIEEVNYNGSNVLVMEKEIIISKIAKSNV